jgi:hypothetical protein
MINFNLVSTLMEVSRKLIDPVKHRSAEYFRDDLLKTVAAFPYEARKIWINFFFNFDDIKCIYIFLVLNY